MNALAVTDHPFSKKQSAINGDHTYTVRLYQDGNQSIIDVDDRFLHAAHHAPGGLRKTPRRQPRDLGAVVEKAYASLSPEGYDGI